MEELAPIVLFVYNRPLHTIKTVEALLANDLSDLSEIFIYSDYPKNEKDKNDVGIVRKYIKSIKGFKRIKVVERKENYGLVKSITEGVTEILETYGKIIVMEDDLVTHPQFLNYMNEALKYYQFNSMVYSITGYSHINASFNKINYLELIRLTSTWTWATWIDRWEIFKDGMKDIELLDNNQKLREDFNYDKSYDYYNMIKDKESGKIKSWGIIWYWNVFKRKGLTLFPQQSLVNHIGIDGSGENTRNQFLKLNKISKSEFTFSYPIETIEKKSIREKVSFSLKYRKVLGVFLFLKNSLFERK